METKEWERKIADLVEKSQYKAVVDEHQRLMSRGRSSANARAPISLTAEELSDLSRVEREQYEKRWAAYKLCLVRPSWSCTNSIVKAHVLLGNPSSACELFSRALPRYRHALKHNQVIAYSRDLLLLLISQQTELQEAPYFVSLLAHIHTTLQSYLKHSQITQKNIIGLFQRPIEAALASKDFGTVARLFHELNRYSAPIPTESLVRYTTERSQALKAADLTETEKSQVAYELSRILSLASEDHKTSLDLAIQHLPHSMTIEFKTKKALLFPEAPTADGNAFQDFETLSKLVWPEAPQLSSSSGNVPSPKL